MTNEQPAAPAEVEPSAEVAPVESSAESLGISRDAETPEVPVLDDEKAADIIQPSMEEPESRVEEAMVASVAAAAILGSVGLAAAHEHSSEKEANQRILLLLLRMTHLMFLPDLRRGKLLRQYPSSRMSPSCPHPRSRNIRRPNRIRRLL